MASNIAERLKARARAVEVMVGDVAVRVKAPSLRCKLRYQAMLTNVGDKGDVSVRSDADFSAAAAMMLMENVLNDDGSKAFSSEADIEQIDADDAGLLFDKILELGGMTAAAEEDIEKNS